MFEAYVPRFTYHVNLNERGVFYADVRNVNGKTVYEVRSNNDGTIEEIEDGFMRTAFDLTGLRAILIERGVFSEKAALAAANGGA